MCEHNKPEAEQDVITASITMSCAEVVEEPGRLKITGELNGKTGDLAELLYDAAKQLAMGMGVSAQQLFEVYLDRAKNGE